jgi:hypothetical protein
MANFVYGAIGLIGGSDGFLDKIDGTNLNDGDSAIVVDSNYAYIYRLDATSGATENSPYIISPDTNAGTKRWILKSKDHVIEDLEDLTNRLEISKHYLRLNQSFLSMMWDDFTTTDKTNASYISKVNTDEYIMTPGNAGEWRSITYTAGSSITVCKLVWRSKDSLDHNIEISANNGSNWTTISSGGVTTNLDQEVNIANSGTQIILKVSGGTQGSLLDYTLLVK